MYYNIPQLERVLSVGGEFIVRGRDSFPETWLPHMIPATLQDVSEIGLVAKDYVKRARSLSHSRHGLKSTDCQVGNKEA